MSRKAWAIVSVSLLFVAAYAFLNLWAAADLGYDRSATGRHILSSWFYGFIATAAGSLACAVAAVWPRRK